MSGQDGDSSTRLTGDASAVTEEFERRALTALVEQRLKGLALRR